MRAVFAIDVPSFHVFLSNWVVDASHAAVLPRVLRSCEEIDVFPWNVKTSEELIGPSIGSRCHAWVKDVIAEWLPVR